MWVIGGGFIGMQRVRGQIAIGLELRLEGRLSYVRGRYG